MYKPILLKCQAQGVSGRNEQPTQTPLGEAECSCIGCVALNRASGSYNYQSTAKQHHYYQKMSQNCYATGCKR